MWKDNNNKIEEVFDSLNKIKKYLPFVLYVKKKLHTYICMFMIKGREEADCGFGAANAILFFTVLFTFRNIGRIVLQWNLKNFVRYRTI